MPHPDSVGSKIQKEVVGSAWNEQDVDRLVEGVVIFGGEIGGRTGEGDGGDVGKDHNFTEEAFREGLMLALDDDYETTVDRDAAAGVEALPFCEKLEVMCQQSHVAFWYPFNTFVPSCS